MRGRFRSECCCGGKFRDMRQLNEHIGILNPHWAARSSEDRHCHKDEGERVIIDSRNAYKDIYIPHWAVRMLSDKGKLVWDVTNQSYASAVNGRGI